MPRKMPTIEEARRIMRESAERHRGMMRRPVKPPLVLPEGVIDVTNEQAGRTIAIVGYPGPAEPAGKRKRPGR